MSNYKVKLTVHGDSQSNGAPAASGNDPTSQQQSLISLTQSSLISTQAATDPSLIEITITAKNTVTLEEYAVTRCPFKAEFVTKLEKWIAKKRFSCQPIKGGYQGGEAETTSSS